MLNLCPVRVSQKNAFLSSRRPLKVHTHCAAGGENETVDGFAVQTKNNNTVTIEPTHATCRRLKYVTLGQVPQDRSAQKNVSSRRPRHVEYFLSAAIEGRYYWSMMGSFYSYSEVVVAGWPSAVLFSSSNCVPCGRKVTRNSQKYPNFQANHKWPMLCARCMTGRITISLLVPRTSRTFLLLLEGANNLFADKLCTTGAHAFRGHLPRT